MRDILPPPNQRFGGGFQLFLHVTPSQPLLRERFAEFSVLTSSTRLGPLLLKTESGYGGLLMSHPIARMLLTEESVNSGLPLPT